MRALVVVVILGMIGGGGYWVWKNQTAQATEYKTAPVTRGDLIQTVSATGQVNPKTNVDVGSQVSGIISKIYVDFNSEVTNHQIIAQLDPSNYRAIRDGVKADLASAKAAMELAKAEAERSQALYESKIVAASENDTAVATLHQAEAAVLQKEAALQQAEVNLAYTTIYAPLDGVVISRNIDVGLTVAASLSAPTLFMIANDLTKMQIDALVSEADIGGVETNQLVNFTVDAFPTRNFQGTVLQIRNAAQTNQNVIDYDTVIDVNNSDLKLRPGMTATVSIITAQRTNALKIPNAALRFHPLDPAEAKTNTFATMAGNGGQGRQGGGGFGGGGPGSGGAGGSIHPKPDFRPTRTVYVLAKGPDGKTDIPKPVTVKLGINDGISTQVLDGLNEGDEVIISQSTPGAPVVAGPTGGNPFGGGGRRGF